MRSLRPKAQLEHGSRTGIKTEYYQAVIIVMVLSVKKIQ